MDNYTDFNEIIDKKKIKQYRHKSEKRWYIALVIINILIITSAISVFAYNFKENYKKAGIDPAKFDFFASIAKHESNFNPTVQNKAGAPAFGYFQFMQDGKKWNNISKFAGVDIQTFRNSPILQIKAAEKLANAFLSQFTEEDKKRARELGYSDSALVRGAWMGGVGGVRNFLYKGINASDNHWDKKTGKGSNVKAAMDRGNNYFKKGGILKTR